MIQVINYDAPLKQFCRFLFCLFVKFLPSLYFHRYAAKPEHWRSRIEAKQSAYKEFYSTFGTAEDKTSKEDTFLSDAYKRSQTKELNNRRNEIDDRLTSTAPSLGVSEKNKKSKKRKDVQSKDASGSSKMTENAVSNFLSSDRKDKKRHGKDRPFNASKKMKA